MYWQITKNHYDAAIEHIESNGLNHKPTMFQAFRVTLHDILFNKTIYLSEYKSHLVYEVIKMPTLGIRMANVIRVYVPKEHRGKGAVSKMLDVAHKKEDVIISGKGNYGEIGRLYVARTNIS